MEHALGVARAASTSFLTVFRFLEPSPESGEEGILQDLKPIRAAEERTLPIAGGQLVVRDNVENGFDSVTVVKGPVGNEVGCT